MSALGIIDYKSTDRVIELIKVNLSNNYSILVHINGFSPYDRLARYKAAFKELIDVKLFFSISEQNIGFSGGCNAIIDLFLKLGLKPYLILCNDDLLINSNLVELYLNIVSKSKIKSIAGTKILDESGQILHTTYSFDKIMFVPNRFHMLNKKYLTNSTFVEKLEDKLIHGCFMILSSDVLNLIKQKRGFIFDDRFFAYREETELQLYITRELGEKIYYINGQGLVHFGSVSTGGKNNNIVMYYLNRNSLLISSQYYGIFKHNLYCLYHLFIYFIYSLFSSKNGSFKNYLIGLKDFFNQKYGEFRG